MAAIASGSFGLALTQGTSWAMPALPGVQVISWSCASFSSARMMACSRAPEPTTRIFTLLSLGRVPELALPAG